MDNNSQNSDIFSGEDYTENVVNMDIDCYESLIRNTKILLSKKIPEEIEKTTFSTYFTSVLEDCFVCISQSLELVTSLLIDQDVHLSHLSKLYEYLEDAVCLLQMLSNLIKSVFESAPMSSCNFRSFPTTTGRIILAVFSHCKESETLYGMNLKHVERQLKDLFRTCHELQLTYLMILEKHFIFDLTEKAELDILVEALDINLEIGQAVQTLDVKTMAEQWKGYTMICEKHSDCLKDKFIFNNSSTTLCHMIKNNFKTAIEIDQEDKIAVRSLKVTCFTIKILIRICNIFYNATAKRYDHILELLLYINLNSSSYLELETEKSQQFINLLNTNVSNPTEALISELLVDEPFVNCLLDFDMERFKEQDELLANILLLTTVIKHVIQKNDIIKISKNKLIDSVFKFLPYGHIWFNIGLKFRVVGKSDTDQLTCGLYEHLLTYTLALAVTMNSEEINHLETKMIEAILDTDCYSALFSSNLWELVTRFTSRQFLLSQLVSLCKIYQNLQSHKMFLHSPQQIHLSFTITKLFEVMQDEDRIKIYKQFSVHNENNIGLWCALRINNLPDDLQSSAEYEVFEKLKTTFKNIFTSGVRDSEEMENLITTLKLAATCKRTHLDEALEELIVNAWMAACPNNNVAIPRELDQDSLWSLEYIEALASFTEGKFMKSDNLVKILHVISNMIEKGTSELKLILIDLLCQIACVTHDENKRAADTFLVRTFNSLFQETDNLILNKFYNVLRDHLPNTNLDIVISKVMREDKSLQDTWNQFVIQGTVNDNNEDWKEQLISTLDFRYRHKCIENKNVIELSDSSSVNVIEKTNSKNFDFADIDSLFEAESDSERSEPACKKVKLNTNDADEIIERIEKDTALLCKVKENIFAQEHKNRIRDICFKLNKIID